MTGPYFTGLFGNILNTSKNRNFAPDAASSPPPPKKSSVRPCSQFVNSGGCTASTIQVYIYRWLESWICINLDCTSTEATGMDELGVLQDGSQSSLFISYSYPLNYILFSDYIHYHSANQNTEFWSTNMAPSWWCQFVIAEQSKFIHINPSLFIFMVRVIDMNKVTWIVHPVKPLKMANWEC